MFKEKPKRTKKPKLEKGVSPLTPEQISDRNQRKRMRERAAILSISPLGNGKYQVWGGTEPHIVQETIDGMVSCDCRGWSKARHGNCSHVMKFRLVYGDLKK